MPGRQAGMGKTETEPKPTRNKKSKTATTVLSTNTCEAFFNYFLLLAAVLLFAVPTVIAVFRAKFAHGLLSGDYSKSVENTENAVSYVVILLTFI